MPNETVNVSISGVNGPLTRTLTVSVNATTGVGTATFNWTGANEGLDSISASATITSLNLTSNTAQSRWGFNNIVPTVPSATGQGANSNTFWTFVVIGVFPDGTHTGSGQAVTTSFSGFYLQWTALPGVSYYNIYCTQSVQGSAPGVVATVGLLHGTGTGNGGNNSGTIGGGGPNFPPSITQLWMAAGTTFTYQGDGTTPPATNTTLQVPSLATPSGKLTITPAGTSLVVGSVNTLTVNVSGIVYASVSYIPLLQGTTGSLPLYNSTSSNVFTYPTYNGQPVNKATAITNAWALSGDNTLWQGLVSLTYDGTNINFSYNGSPAATSSGTNVDTTNLTIDADDIAWYNSVLGTYDAFTVQNNAGGLSSTVLVEWLVKPTIASVTPASGTPADGGTHTFVATLSAPFSPRQLGTQFGTGNSLTAAFSAAGGMTVTGFTPLYNANGWLYAWTVTATVPSSTSNVSVTLSARITGIVTYLSGSAFVTSNAFTPVVYVNGIIATLTLVGSASVPPLEYSFTVSPAGPSYATGETITLTGITFQQQNNPITLTFITDNGTTLATGAQSARTTGTFNGQSGYLTSFTGTFLSTTLPASPGEAIGFKATDSTNGLSVTYLTSTLYSSTAVGGGGGGCPAVEMFLDNTHRVYDVIPGFAVDTLVGESTEYVNGFRGTEDAEIISMNHDIQFCFRLTAENGAEVIISGSTPVPTKETLDSLVCGITIDELSAYASEMQPGMHVVTDVGHGLEWSSLVAVVPIGMRQVCRLYCGGRNFAAGVNPGKYIFTHNIVAPIVK